MVNVYAWITGLEQIAKLLAMYVTTVAIHVPVRFQMNVCYAIMVL